MSQNFIIEKLKQEFGGRESFSRKALFDFFLQFEPDLKESTFRWRIYNLKTKGMIRSLSRQLFTLAYKPEFEPLIGERERKISSLIQAEFKTLRFSVWSIRVINEFMLHQPGRFFIVVEVEKEAVESVFYFLKDNNVKNIFLEPDEKEISKYMSDMQNAVVVIPLISKAPIQKVKKTPTITIEKLLVDLFSDKKLFNMYQGSELAHIYNNAYSRYKVDITKLFHYASRRGKVYALKLFISQKTDIPKKLSNDRQDVSVG